MDPFLRLRHDLLREGVHPEVVAIFGDDVSAGEYVVALEYLTDTILEYEIVVSDRVKRQIKCLCGTYDVKRPSYVELVAQVRR